MKEQQMRISDEEISVLKNTFAENDVLLKSVRKAMLGLPMDADERTYLNQVFSNPQLKKVVRRCFLPEIEGDVPLGQNMDLWMTISFVDRTPEMAHLVMQARHLLIEMLESGLKQLTEPEFINLVQFEVTKDAEQDYIHLTARNSFINHLDQQLIQIKFLAGRKEETVEQTKARLQKDSNK